MKHSTSNRMHYMDKRFLMFSFVLFVTALLLVSCGGGGGDTSIVVGGGAAQGQAAQADVGSVSIETGSLSLVADGTSTTAIRATVLGTDGQPITGVDVTFTTTLGTITLAAVSTDDDGIAETRLTSTTLVGTATVMAAAEGYYDDLEIIFEAGAPTNITLAAAPDTINPGGSAALTATVADANGNDVFGETVNFLITSNNSGGSLSALSATSDVNGQAIITYTAGNAAGIDTVRVVSTSNTGVLNTETITVSVDAAVVGSVTVSSGAASLIANGSSTAVIRATVLDTSNQPVSGVAVTFSTTLGTIPGAAVTTDLNGIAEATLTSATDAGIATVVATGSGFSDEIDVVFVAGAATSLTVVNAPATVNPGGSSTVTATVADTNGNPVIGKTVNFLIMDNNSGGDLSSLSATTNVNGQAVVTYTAGNSDGTDTVSATLSSNLGISDTETITVSVDAVVVGSITVSSGAASLIANGLSTAVIRATVLDTGNQPVSGVAVTFSTTLGTIPGAAVTTDLNGIAEATLAVGTNMGTATVYANASGFVDTVSVDFIAGPAANILLTAAPTNMTADGNSTSTIRAIVTDANGNPVADGEIVTFSVTTGSGDVSALFASTSGGVASVTYTASASDGTEVVTAKISNGTTETANITLIAEQVASIALIVDDSSLVADATNSTLVRATVTNLDGNVVADGTTVNFATTAGVLSGNSDTTTDGVAVVSITSTATTGQAVITATAGSVAQVATVQFVPGVVVSATGVSISANPTTIDADGSDFSVITVSVEDGNSNPVEDGTTVNFYTTAGTLSFSSATTANGLASVSLTGSDAASAIVEARVGGFSDTTNVTIGASGTGSGEPIFIELTASPDTIQVKGSGGSEVAIITATVLDEYNQPYADSADNLEFEIVTGIGGGETLSATTATTVDGIATVSLQAGTIAGTIRIRVRAVNDASGAACGGGYCVEAFSTLIGIEAGEPYNLTIFGPGNISVNADGTYSAMIGALVQDQYSNPVEDDTGVYFGLVDNSPDGYLVSGADGGTTAGDTTFTSAAITAALGMGDTVIIHEGSDRGGYMVDDVAVIPGLSLELVYTMSTDASGLDFVAGNAELGTVCGVVPTGGPFLDTTCTPTESPAPTIKGVAHSLVTWVPGAIFKPYYLYAETRERSVGDTISDNYYALAPVTIDLSLEPSTVLAGASTSAVAEFYDGNPTAIVGETITFESTNTGVANFGGNDSTTTDTTNGVGLAGVTVDTTECLSENKTVTIIAKHGQYFGSSDLTVTATAPRADFTGTDLGDGKHVDFASTSTLPAGGEFTYSWDFDDDAVEDSDAENPGIIDLGVAGDYPVTLTVTNTIPAPSCSHTIQKLVIVPPAAP